MASFKLLIAVCAFSCVIGVISVPTESPRENEVVAEPESRVSAALLASIEINNVEEALEAFEDGIVNGERLKTELAESFLSRNFEAALQDPYVVNLNALAFVSLVSRPWTTNETYVLRAALQWLEKNKANTSEAVQRAILSHIYLEALTLKELSEVVFESGLFTKTELLETFIQKTRGYTSQRGNLRFEGQLAETNVISGHSATLQGASCDSGFVLGRTIPNKTCRAIGNEILITLGSTFQINRITATQRESNYNFYMYVSDDKVNWQSIDYLLHQSETWSFKERPVRYLKLVRSPSTARCDFLDIKAYYFKTASLDVTYLSSNITSTTDKISAYGFTSQDEALMAFNDAIVNGDNSQLKVTERYLSQHIEAALKTSSVQRLNILTLQTLLSKTWIVSEIEMFNALSRWFGYNGVGESALRKLGSYIHLSALPIQQLSDVSRYWNYVFSEDALLDAFLLKLRPSSNPLPLQRFANQLASENVASYKMLASIEGGECTPGFKIGEENENEACASDGEIVITLGASFVINRLAIQTLGGTYVQVYISNNKSYWQYLFSTSNTNQEVSLVDTPVRYIKIASYYKKSFDLTGIDAYCVK